MSSAVLSRICFIATFTVLTFVAPLAVWANSPSLYVDLFQARSRIDSFYVKAPFVVVNPVRESFTNGLFVFSQDGDSIALRKVGNGNPRPILRAPYVVLSDRGGITLQIGPEPGHLRKYFGEVTIKKRTGRKSSGNSNRSGGLLATNLIDLFNYVSSVVGGETTAAFDKEALKAQAVLVFTRLAPKGRHPTVPDTTDEMVYLGAEYERPEVIDAVNEVNMCRLMYRDRPAQVFFHACCAGRTSRGVDVFGAGAKSLTYLQSVPCNFCKRSPLYEKTVKNIPASIFQSTLTDAPPQVTALDEAKRPISVDIVKNGRKETLSGYQFWMRIGQKLGWDKAPGTRYQIEKTGGNYVISSNGGGHGVGLCQWGAQGLAKQKKTCEQILQFYFPGTTLEKRLSK